MPEAVPQELEEYTTDDGRTPFSDWLRKVRDRDARVRVRVRLDRLSLGSFGNCKSLGSGLHELRIDHGPGYRVYFGRIGDRIVLLLCGGSKKTQTRDIDVAQSFWQDYMRRSS